MRFKVGDIVSWSHRDSGWEGSILGYDPEKAVYTVNFYKDPRKPNTTVSIKTYYQGHSLVFIRSGNDFSKEAEWE